MQSDLERKLAQTQSLNDDLQSELRKAQDSHEESEYSLRSQIDQITSKASGGGEWKIRFESLDKEHQEMRAQLLRQEKTTSEVRQDAAGWLNQMKALSERNDPSHEREEKLVHQVHAMEKELQDWKARYARTKTQARTLRTSSSSPALEAPDAGAIAKGFVAQDGLIKDVHVAGFQIAIDELLQSARKSDPHAVLGFVKSVVVAVRNITLDLGDLSSGKDEVMQQRHRQKAKLSATSNNLITAAKNFAISKGLSPVSLLDAAASHVAATVVEVIHSAKICQTPSGELEDDDDNSIIADSPADYYGISHSRASAGGDSIYSSMSSPRRSQVPSNLSKALKPIPNGIPNGVSHAVDKKPVSSTHQVPDSRMEDLKVGPHCPCSRAFSLIALQHFLDSRTDALIPSIQSLVSSIRTNGEPPDILDHLASITSTTSQIINKTSEDAHSDDRQLNDILQSLAESVDKLEDAGREGEEIGNVKDWEGFVKGLPPLAFAIAKSTKELGTWVEGMRGKDDFS